MQPNKIPLEETRSFSPLFLDYMKEAEGLKKFYGHFPDIEGFRKQIMARQSLPDGPRETLHAEMLRQYAGFTVYAPQNIEALRSRNTFTVTTGHQLNIFTGPLYFIYKIATAVNLAKRLKAAFPEHDFVPVYWMATEDHDFEEISSFRLFGKKHKWDAYSNTSGAVGRLHPGSLSGILEQFPEIPEMFRKAYLEKETLAEATRYFVNELFGKEGLLIIDGDSRALKSCFSGIMRGDLLQGSANEKITEASDELQALGYKTQIYPRNINLFLLGDGSRERIVAKGDGSFFLNDSGTAFSEKEMMDLLDSEPERFSPNVALRPMYQEMLLPNLAYIGGPAEVSYWLQLSKAFQYLGIMFPIVMPRNFALILNKANAQKAEKLGVTIQDLFLDEDSLRKKFVGEKGGEGLSLSEEMAKLEALFDVLVVKAASVDKTLEGFILAEGKKAEKIMESIEKRLKKSEEKKHETELEQLIRLKEKLFPDGNPQERAENFLNFYINDPEFISKTLKALDPLDFSFYVLEA